jgi:hypothetical protein
VAERAGLALALGEGPSVDAGQGSPTLATDLALADTAPAGLLPDAGAQTRPSDSGPDLIRPQHPEVHQAIGMLCVRLDVTVTVALDPAARLRLHAPHVARRSGHDVAGMT